MTILNPTMPASRLVHICYNVEKVSDSLKLEQIVEAWYPHPEAPNDAMLPVIERIPLGTYDTNDKQYAACYLLYNCQQVINR